jgi:hypothetical protein
VDGRLVKKRESGTSQRVHKCGNTINQSLGSHLLLTVITSLHRQPKSISDNREIGM